MVIFAFDWRQHKTSWDEMGYCFMFLLFVVLLSEYLVLFVQVDSESAFSNLLSKIYQNLFPHIIIFDSWLIVVEDPICDSQNPNSPQHSDSEDLL